VHTAGEVAPGEPPAVLIAVGASAGGVEALTRLVAALPPDLPAALVVVLHLAPEGPSVLPRVLAHAGPLPAVHPRAGERLLTGRIYVCPPDVHLLVDGARVVLDRGPRENGVRPAVDPLFRSVAESYGAAGIGVVLSGMLDDGSAGLAAIKAAGGQAFVQDPAEAAFPRCPRAPRRAWLSTGSRSPARSPACSPRRRARSLPGSPLLARAAEA
jgi:two-component system chemotaxis response regulator CheB